MDPGEPFPAPAASAAGEGVLQDDGVRSAAGEEDELLAVDSRLPSALAAAASRLSEAAFDKDVLKTLGKVVQPGEHWEGVLLARAGSVLGFAVFGYRRPAVQMTIKF